MHISIEVNINKPKCTTKVCFEEQAYIGILKSTHCITESRIAKVSFKVCVSDHNYLDLNNHDSQWQHHNLGDLGDLNLEPLLFAHSWSDFPFCISIYCFYKYSLHRMLRVLLLLLCQNFPLSHPHYSICECMRLLTSVSASLAAPRQLDHTPPTD